MQRLLIAMLLVLTACAGDDGAPTTPEPTTAAAASSKTTSAQIDEGTLFGFFPFPNGTEFADVVAHFEDLAEHGDVVLVQPEVPWEDFAAGIPSEPTAAMQNVQNITLLASQAGLEVIYVVDPLNGLDRTSFLGLPTDWAATFQDPMVGTAFTEFSRWIATEFHPRYLGLSSEINTYLAAHPGDTDAYLGLYRSTRDRVKAESPDTQVFVTFQWEVVHGLADGALDPEPQWDQIELFEPDLDLWVISSYPFVSFPTGADIPNDYYSALLDRTDKQLAVAEGGYLSRPTGPFPGDEQSQVDQLAAVHDQIGERLDFWINLVLDDFDPEAIADPMREQGRSESDITGLGIFSSIGLRAFDETPKPALGTWEAYRSGD